MLCTDFLDTEPFMNKSAKFYLYSMYTKVYIGLIGKSNMRVLLV
jgi:hypothetical protein